jgi:tetratricopeptide (TPR) repeat protein
LSTNAFSDGSLTAAAGGEESHRSRRTRVRRSRTGPLLTRAGVVLSAAVLVAAPLLGGGVHRVTLVVIMSCAAVALSLILAGSTLERRGLRLGAVVIVPLAFLVVPVLQSIPVPMGIRAALDAHGNALLTDNAVDPPRVWPLSLDPASTRVHIGKAAAALAVFIVAFHLASGQTRRHLVTRVVAAAGIGAVAIGIGHKILGAAKIYGVLVSTQRTLLIGPFVNANHTAELLELAAFACLACSFHRRTALNRVGWMVGFLMCAGGAAATLSRGAVLGMAAGLAMFALLRYLARDQETPQRRRVSLAWGAFVVGLVVLAGGALGAGQLVDRFAATGVSKDVRFQLWRDSLRVLAAHPMGIGRGAFDRVYPVYRTLKDSQPVRFAFVENHPLQLLIDSGWVLTFVLAAGLVFATWQLFRRGRREKLDAALIAGLFAVVVHSFVDFGLETPGVLLPFVAVLATVLGRCSGAGETSRASRALVVSIALGGLVVGVASVASASNDDFDGLLKTTVSAQSRRALLERAQRVHPLDYYYALAISPLEPIKGPAGGPSPRFHALNRALSLCPSCDAVHVEVARNLWRMGLRPQALLEWRSAVEARPQLLTSALGELFTSGAKATQLASLASSDPIRMLEVASFLSSASRIEDAMIVLDQAEASNVPVGELLLMRAKLQLLSHNLPAAQATIARAHALGVRDVRLAILDAQLSLDVGGPSGTDQALATLDLAAAQYPSNVEVQRMRVDIVGRFGKWQAADRALEGLKQALYHERGSAAEAHVAAARIFTRLSRFTNALGEYRIALADDSTNVSLWLEFGHAAEAAGRDQTARDAYSEAGRLSPKSPEVVRALQALDNRAPKLGWDGRPEP